MSETIWDIIKSKKEEYNPAFNDASNEAKTAWEQNHGSIDNDFFDKLSGLTLQADDSEGGHRPFEPRLPTKLEPTHPDDISDLGGSDDEREPPTLTEEEQKRKEKARREATKRHQEAVRKTITFFNEKGLGCSADGKKKHPWDIYVVEKQLLIEVKDTQKSELDKMETAYGHLDFSEHTLEQMGEFEWVDDTIKITGNIHKFGLFTKKPRDDLIEKFEAKGNYVMWLENEELTGTQRATGFLESIGIDLN